MGRSLWRAGSYQVTRSAGWGGSRGGRQLDPGPAPGCGSRLAGQAAPGSCGGSAVGGGDGGGDQGDVAGVEVAEDGAQVDGDGGVAEAGGDPEDGLLGGGAGQQPGVEGAQGSIPGDGGERLAGADARAGGDDAAEGVAVQEVPVADDQLGGGGVGGDAGGGVQELAGQLGDRDGGGVHGDASWEKGWPGGTRRRLARGGGRRLSGHEVSRAERVPGRPANRSKASTGVRQPNSGPGRPGKLRGSDAVAELVVDLAGDVALQAADDLFPGQPFLGAPLDVGAGGRVARAGAHPGDHDPPQGVVSLAVAAAVEAMTADLPRGGGDRRDGAQVRPGAFAAQPL